MIFAHLGLMKYTGIQVEYGQSTSQVYEKFARTQITETHSLELLGYVEDVALEQRRPRMPSWVPDVRIS